jgi:cathepsin A (carboxypeptidase C)
MLVNLMFISLSAAVILKDRMVTFPGFPEVPAFDIYSGYLDVPNSKGKALHYVFLESQNDPTTDPVVLWMNGGPGCSSMDGLFYEHGPYVFIGQGLDLTKNPYSWNTNASVLYLEAPAGVGFSMMGDASNNYTTDQITAHDNLLALIQFFKGFYEYRHNSFYISGESYAGIYVPTLALTILSYNAHTQYAPINLVGIAVGNGVTDWTVDTDPALMKMLWTHGMLSPYWNNQLMKNCDNYNDFSSFACQNVTGMIYETIIPDLNIYGIYGECFSGPATFQTFRDNQMRMKYLLGENRLKVIPPCAAWEGINTYLNNPLVQKAFHIDPSITQWNFCVDLDYQVDTYHGALYTYPDLINAGLNILIYSGDTDGAVPLIGTRNWIRKLNLGILEEYRSWYVDEQVAGYTILYTGLRLVSVKGAGHIVPQDKPAQAHHMFLSWLFGSSL